MRRNKKLLIIAGIGISILIGLFLWNNKNDNFFITGQASNEDYILGVPTFYRRETVEALERGEIFSLPNENSDMGFDLRSYNIEKLSLEGYELYHSIDETAVMHSSAVTIERIMEINDLLPVDKKIRVISISMGLDKFAKGYRRAVNAIEEAKKEGIFVITTSTEINYGFSLMGLGREAKLNPDDMEFYGPGIFWREGLYKGYVKLDADKVLLVPMDSRTYADWTSTNDYEYCSVGGVSWSVPWLAGLYALCLEKQPDLTPDVFITKAFETGTEREIIQEGECYTLGTIINPVELMDSL